MAERTPRDTRRAGPHGDGNAGETGEGDGSPAAWNDPPEVQPGPGPNRRRLNRRVPFPMGPAVEATPGPSARMEDDPSLDEVVQNIEAALETASGAEAARRHMSKLSEHWRRPACSGSLRQSVQQAARAIRCRDFSGAGRATGQVAQDPDGSWFALFLRSVITVVQQAAARDECDDEVSVTAPTASSGEASSSD